jgi:hypothetical protein
MLTTIQVWLEQEGTGEGKGHGKEKGKEDKRERLTATGIHVQPAKFPVHCGYCASPSKAPSQPLRSQSWASPHVFWQHRSASVSIN